MNNDKVYRLNGNSFSEQGEQSTANPAASNVQMRILAELQVISMILHDAYAVSDDLRQMRQDAVDQIT